MIVLEDAYCAAGRGDMEAHNRIIREKVEELDESYEQLVLAQVSMAEAVMGGSAKHAAVYTSPDSACKALLRSVGKDGQ